jgi:hypothetical protein
MLNAKCWMLNDRAMRNFFIYKKMFLSDNLKFSI